MKLAKRMIEGTMGSAKEDKLRRLLAHGGCNPALADALVDVVVLSNAQLRHVEQATGASVYKGSRREPAPPRSHIDLPPYPPS